MWVCRKIVCLRKTKDCDGSCGSVVVVVVDTVVDVENLWSDEDLVPGAPRWGRRRSKEGGPFLAVALLDRSLACSDGLVVGRVGGICRLTSPSSSTTPSGHPIHRIQRTERIGRPGGGGCIGLSTAGPTPIGGRSRSLTYDGLEWNNVGVLHRGTREHEQVRKEDAIWVRFEVRDLIDVSRDAFG